jgi:hypothetical protein
MCIVVRASSLRGWGIAPERACTYDNDVRPDSSDMREGGGGVVLVEFGQRTLLEFGALRIQDKTR